MAVSTKEYYEGLLKQAGVSEAKRQALVAALEDEDVSKALANEQVVPRMRHDEYSREMDKLRADQKKTTDYYSSLATWQATEQQKIDDFWKQQANGNGNGNGTVSDGEWKKALADMEKRFQEEGVKRDQNYIGLLKVGMRLASQHVNEFHEPLDTDALAKVAVDKGISLEQAYTEMVSPRRTELQSKAFDEKLRLAREEGAREFASKHRIPVDSSPREQHHAFFGTTNGEPVVTDYKPNSGQLSNQSFNKLREGFVEEFNKASSASTSTQ